jgi:hypothetical protein
MDALGVEAVHRLVEHHGGRISEQRGRDAEPLPHTERELSRPLAGDLVESHEVDHLVDAPARDPLRPRQREQVIVGRAAGVHRSRLEQRAHLVQRRGMVTEMLAVDAHVAGRRRIQAHDQAHRRRFPGAVRSEEARDDARLHGEGDAVDRSLLAVVLGQIVRFDHGATVDRARARSPRRKGPTLGSSEGMSCT